MLPPLVSILAQSPGSESATEATSGDYALLFFYLFLALGVSFLCSLVEACILSLSRSDVALMAKGGSRTGRMAEAMKNNIDRPLAAILTLNTVAHTFGAAGVGAQSLVIFKAEWVAVSNAIVTLLVLVFSEIIPKTLGAVYARKLTPPTVYTIQGMIWLTWPLVVALNALSRMLGSSHGIPPSREEVAVVADMAKEAGVLEPKERHVIHNLLKLKDIQVRDIMTPRNVVFMVQQDTTVAAFLDAHQTLPFSRIPVFDKDQDQIVGIARRYDILHLADEKRATTSLKDLAVPAHRVAESASVADTLDEFVHRQEHLFVVDDSFSGTAGIVTLEDTVETLLGVEIVDETDSVADMRELARRRGEERRIQRQGRRGTNASDSKD